MTAWNSSEARRERLREVTRQIAALKAGAELGVPDSFIPYICHSILWDYTYQHMVIGFEALFRARKHKEGVETFDHIERLLAPPPVSVAKRGRFNDRFDPRFYATSHFQACLWEMRPKRGDVITILVVGRRNEKYTFKAAQLGMHKCTLFDPPIENIRDDQEFQAMLDKEGLKEIWLAQDEFLTELATKEFWPGDSQKSYLASTTAARIFEQRSECEGIVYPTVATRLNGINFCLRPETVARQYFPTEAWVLKITGEPLFDGTALQFRFLKVSKSISDDGTIEWSDISNRHTPWAFVADAKHRVCDWRKKADSAG